MKTTRFLKAVAVIALLVAGVIKSNAQSQDGFITNEVMKGEQVVSKTIFKKDGAYLYKHMMYEYKYDESNRLTTKIASKWDSTKEEWTPYFKLTYQYNDNKITTFYARWNNTRKVYDANEEKSVCEMNDENMPVAYTTYKQVNSSKSSWNMVNHNRMDGDPNLFATTK
ncbi:DUF3836 domain-containing protein [Bacteroidaceae bacterium HV4-6-C5C]|jgi:hypothetical protein|nr:DUF3836 domain-containing protein [Bacteroidaceae bacterium HV4-6-C5C]